MHAPPSLFRSLLELQAMVDELAAQDARRRADARRHAAAGRRRRREQRGRPVAEPVGHLAGMLALLHR